MSLARLLSILVVLISATAPAAAADSNPNVRMLPYPFSHVVSFSSDVDMQRAWHGMAIHRVFNEDIGLTISDSLWPQGSTYASVLFLGPGTLNRTTSGVGTQPVFALLLRQWHRGNIDHFHGWQEDGVFQIRNDIDPPLVMSGIRSSQNLPDVLREVAGQKAQNVRLYFSSEPPSDLTIVLHEKLGKTISIAAGAIARGANIQAEVGKFGWIVEVIVPAVSSDPLTLAINPMLVDRIELLAPSCAGGCAAKLVRVERDHFSRQTVISQSRWLEQWNIRPALLTSHGGNTLIQDYGVEGKSLELPRTPGTLLADKAMVVKREALADRRQSHAYHSDILKRIGVIGVWSYFPAEAGHLYGPLFIEKLASRLPPLTTSYSGFYNVPRSTVGADVSSEQKFVESMKSLAPNTPDETLRSIYCGASCNMSQGDALAVLLSQSIYLVNIGKRVLDFWYTHFGSGGSDFKPSLENPVTPNVLKWMRRLANFVYNFDNSVGEERRIWSPPANSWLRYQIMQAGIDAHVQIGGNRSAVRITQWNDPVTHAVVPDVQAGTRDLHGLTLYVDDPDSASVRMGKRIVETFTRNPPDASGRRSITIVDDNTPTPLIGRIALRERGDVDAKTGKFADSSSTRDYISLKADSGGRATIVFKPWALDLWNTSHVHVAIRKRLSTTEKSSMPKGSFKIELVMEDGGVICILEGSNLTQADAASSIWRVPTMRVINKWQLHTLDVTRFIWPQVTLTESNWRRPPLPLGRVREVRIILTGAVAGEILDIRHLRALRPSGNGEAPGAVKLVAGRITIDGKTPLPLVPVEATSEFAETQTTATDSDGYYFFYGRKRHEQLAIRAILGKADCYSLQGRKVEVLKNEAEIDIQANLCARKR